MEVNSVDENKLRFKSYFCRYETSGRTKVIHQVVRRLVYVPKQWRW
jgi:hypothetical protein